MTADSAATEDTSAISKGHAFQLLLMTAVIAACLGFVAGAYVASNTSRLSSLLNERKVRVRFYKDSAGFERFRVEDKSEFLVELDKEMLQPPARMPSGAWVLLLASAWSGSDLQMIDTASQAADELGGEFKFGAVICDSPTDAQEIYESRSVEVTPDFPIWLVVIDGKICGEARGTLSTTNVVELARSSAAKVLANQSR